jgi:hypothetical protein
MCSVAPAPLTPVALSVLVFGGWMVLLGVAFALLPLVAKRLSPETLERLSFETGFPSVAGVWSRLFGLAIGAFGLFYFVAAAFELRPFFWMSVFGRVGVFVTCTLLSWTHRRGKSGQTIEGPPLLLWFAVPDLIGATVTASLMLPSLLARVAFVGGIALLTGGLSFFTFPDWVLRLVGLQVQPGTWNVVLGALLTFFGVYDVTAAVAALDPLIFAAMLANLLLLAALLGELLRERDATKTSWQVKAVVAGLLVATGVALFGATP